MARLNEAPAAVDAVETLKRKFLRQNRDIARDNSAKSIRIRNLENEISRLLEENLGLRAEISRLDNEMGVSRNRRIREHVKDTKSKLEIKLEEISALLSGLENVPKGSRQSLLQTEQKKPVILRSPIHKVISTTNDAAAGLDGKLPPILENKQYPRRTLDQAEILSVMSNQASDTTDSPDIGPPPVSHFVDEDSVKIDLSLRPSISTAEKVEGDHGLSSNLEHRKKRRESTGVLSSTRSSKAESTGLLSGPSLKTGAKRKMSVREDEPPNPSIPIEASPEDFKYFRRNVDDKGSSRAASLSTRETATIRTTRELAAARGVRDNNISASTPLPSRRALGAKNSNFDVCTSPRKTAKGPMHDEVAAAKNDLKEAQKGHVRSLRTAAIPIIPPTKPVVNEAEILVDDSDHSEPETPIPTLDLLSPQFTNPSTSRPTSRDTPPPPDLGSSQEEIRPSRRARVSVSYAEPNLRDKMRRPTKELVDAVTGEGKSQRQSILSLDGEAPTTAIKIKEETDATDTWKGIPSSSAADEYSRSPLGNRSSEPPIRIDAMEDSRSHRRRSQQQPNGEKPLVKSRSSSTISALMGGPKRAKPEPEDDGPQAIGQAMANLDIYDFTDTSPRDAARPLPTMREERQARVARKASSAGLESNQMSDGASLDGESGVKPLMSSRRRQSHLGLEIAQFSKANLDSESSGITESSLKRSTSSAAMQEATENVRTARAAGRRRSMML